MTWLTAYWQTLSPLEQVLAVLVIVAGELCLLRWLFPLPRSGDVLAQPAVPDRGMARLEDRRHLSERVQDDVRERRDQQTATHRTVATARARGEYANTTGLRLTKKGL